jgi:hypothetical protein
MRAILWTTNLPANALAGAANAATVLRTIVDNAGTVGGCGDVDDTGVPGALEDTWDRTPRLAHGAPPAATRLMFVCHASHWFRDWE